MSNQKVDFSEYESEGQASKLIQKSKDSPFVPIGIAGFLGVAALGAYNYKNRGKVTTSVYLMQLRVAAQGTVVGALCLGLIYSMTNRYLLKKD
ncbi:HIG1 domain family member 1A, mitochondrial-like [Contarinia nasturtii]|uniref:HIG1 domain family member 1A, mitochondrial-like n=1 Tax=Contarinia nasturtii TaxID=265458 RepID=UPI0012D4B92C|nr:HIG1 domain family member 1A, mitochondrial-like [Contarinia nasturtii]